MVGEALSKNHLNPFACNELSSILSQAYSQLPKNVKALIFQDDLSAFRLLPDVNISAAVSAANHLLKSVEAELPKQKNIAIVEFKQAKVALKRRNKSHEEDIVHGTKQRMMTLCVDHNLTFTSNHKVSIRVQSGIDWRESFKKEYIDLVGDIAVTVSIVWHEKSRYPNKQCRLKSDKKPLDLISTHQVLNYLLGIASSSDESESDDEAVPGLWAYDRSWDAHW